MIFPNLHLDVGQNGRPRGPQMSFSLAGSQLWGPGPNAGLPALRHFQASLRTCPAQGPKIIVPPARLWKLPLSRVGSKVLVQVIRSKSERFIQPKLLFALAGNEALQGVAGCARHGQRGYGSVDSNHGPIFGAHLGSARDRGAGPPGGRLRIGIGAGDL